MGECVLVCRSDYFRGESESFFSFCGELRRRENENETGFQNFMIIEERGQQRPTSMSCNSRARYPRSRRSQWRQVRATKA